KPGTTEVHDRSRREASGGHPIANATTTLVSGSAAARQLCQLLYWELCSACSDVQRSSRPGSAFDTGPPVSRPRRHRHSQRRSGLGTGDVALPEPAAAEVGGVADDYS